MKGLDYRVLYYVSNQFYYRNDKESCIFVPPISTVSTGLMF